MDGSGFFVDNFLNRLNEIKNLRLFSYNEALINFWYISIILIRSNQIDLN